MKRFLSVGFITLAVTLTSGCSYQTVGDVLEQQQTNYVSNIEARITNCGFDTGTDPAVSITNNNDQLMQIFVDIGVYDATGTQVDSKLLIETVPSGRTASKSEWNNGAYVEGGRCEIIDITAYPQ
jgi:hypothetical protein